MDKGVLLLEERTGMFGRQKQQMSISYSSSKNTYYNISIKNNRIQNYIFAMIINYKILNSYCPGVKEKLRNKTRTTTQIRTIWQCLSVRGNFAHTYVRTHTHHIQDIWQCLDTFLTVKMDRCYWYQMCRIQGCY